MHTLISHRLDRVMLIKQADLGLSGSCQRNRIIVICRETYVDIQPLICKIAALDCRIEKSVQGIGIPVKNDIHLSKVPGFFFSGRFLLGGGRFRRRGSLCAFHSSRLPGATLRAAAL